MSPLFRGGGGGGAVIQRAPTGKILPTPPAGMSYVRNKLVHPFKRKSNPMPRMCSFDDTPPDKGAIFRPPPPSLSLDRSSNTSTV